MVICRCLQILIHIWYFIYAFKCFYLISSDLGMSQFFFQIFTLQFFSATYNLCGNSNLIVIGLESITVLLLIVFLVFLV